MKSPGNRGRGHGEHIDVGPEPLELLLMGDTEALLLVHDREAQPPEADILLQQPVGADHDIDLAGRELFKYRALLLATAEPGEHFDFDREGREAVPEGVEVLEAQNRGRDQNGNLEAIVDGLEGRSERHLRLAVADITADQPVHWAGLLHILFDRS